VVDRLYFIKKGKWKVLVWSGSPERRKRLGRSKRFHQLIEMCWHGLDKESIQSLVNSDLEDDEYWLHWESGG
jgi:hypothetical protein